LISIDSGEHQSILSLDLQLIMQFFSRNGDFFFCAL
jgi:hypothetical protein